MVDPFNYDHLREEGWRRVARWRRRRDDFAVDVWELPYRGNGQPRALLTCPATGDWTATASMRYAANLAHKAAQSGDTSNFGGSRGTL